MVLDSRAQWRHSNASAALHKPWPLPDTVRVCVHVCVCVWACVGVGVRGGVGGGSRSAPPLHTHNSNAPELFYKTCRLPRTVGVCVYVCVCVCACVCVRVRVCVCV